MVTRKVNTGRGYVGQYKTLKEAVEARKNAEHIHGFHENHGSVRPL